MGLRGRALIDSEYNAALNVPLIVRTMKDAVDRQRAGRARSLRRVDR
jgi:hypothetical protein